MSAWCAVCTPVKMKSFHTAASLLSYAVCAAALTLAPVARLMSSQMNSWSGRFFRSSVAVDWVAAAQALDDVTLAMKQAASFAHRADEIVQEDKPGRQHGQLGRTAEIDSLRAQATQQAEAAARAALSARGTTAAVQNAAVDLINTGMTNGLDWAKVTIAIGAAVEASSKATETAQHAAEATLADSRALDADNKAEEHAANAKKWREEAERQAQTAADLADAAKKQQEIAIGARDRAKAQQAVAEAAAAQARQHAAEARAARINAQGAASNAVAKSNAAVAANNDAVRDKVREDGAIEAAGRTAKELQTATSVCFGKQTLADQVESALKAAREQAIKEGKDADAATRDIAADAQRARAAANESAAWAARARAAAATAKSEADAASAAARRSRAAAAAADQEAVTARRAADDANQLAMQAANVAMVAQSSADQTRVEAEGAVSEANQAVFQAQVADAAGASASMVIDPAHTADVIAKPYAAINCDARQAMSAATDALLLSQELAKSARDKATEADQAADRAKKAADAAIADVKPAYDAAARAAQSAQQAAQYAVGAVGAANAAAGYAHGAHVAASNATRSASAAQSDAVIAGRSASMATNAAYTAGRAAAAAEAIQQWAEKATSAINNFRDEVGKALDKFEDEKAKAIEADRLLKEEAERKRQELNKEFLGGLFTVGLCLVSPTSLPCQEMQHKVTGAVLDGMGAAADYVKDGIQCSAGDQSACQRYNDATEKIRAFMKQALDGFVESAKGFWEGLKGIGNCVVQGVSAGGGPACDQLGEGLKDLIKNPYKIIHLDVWHDDPGKALGMTTFDVLTVVATIPLGGSGGALSKVLEGITSMVGKAATTLVSGLGKIAEFAVKVLDRTTGKLADSLADVVNLTIKIENGVAKVEAWNVLFDGNVFKLKPFEIQVAGDLSKLEGAIGRIDGGVITFKGDVAKLEGATFRFDPAPEGTKPPTFPKTSYEDPVTKTWEGTEFGRTLRLTKDQNLAANAIHDAAEKAAVPITKKIQEIEGEVPGGKLDGLENKVKSPDSLKAQAGHRVRQEPGLGHGRRQDQRRRALHADPARGQLHRGRPARCPAAQGRRVQGGGAEELLDAQRRRGEVPRHQHHVVGRDDQADVRVPAAHRRQPGRQGGRAPVVRLAAAAQRAADRARLRRRAVPADLRQRVVPGRRRADSPVPVERSRDEASLSLLRDRRPQLRAGQSLRAGPRVGHRSRPHRRGVLLPSAGVGARRPHRPGPQRPRQQRRLADHRA